MQHLFSVGSRRSPAATAPLQPGRAVSLQPKERGTLRLASGCLWATLDGPHQGPANDWGDRVLCPGDELALRAGQRLVIESWRADAPAAYSWHPAP